MSTASDTGVSRPGASVQLEPVLDLGAAERLHVQLKALRGRPLEIDASEVERLGGLCLQVLISARNTWRADGVEARISRPSQAFRETWTLLSGPAFLEARPYPFSQEGPYA